MMEMEITLNQDKILREGFDYNNICKKIDDVFARWKCVKTIPADGTMRYAGKLGGKNYFSDFGCVFVNLRDQKWFIDNCVRWILFDNDDDEGLPYQEIDVLKKLGK